MLASSENLLSAGFDKYLCVIFSFWLYIIEPERQIAKSLEMFSFGLK